MFKTTLAAAGLALCATLAAGAALAYPGDDAHPIALHMAPGTDTITIHGVLSQKLQCCSYTFKAHAGQQFYFTETGAAARIGLTYPNGDGVNPGLPSPTKLPADGAYTFIVAPDLMADGAYGPFTVKIRIPPR
jgi:hypothetical protein